VEAILTNPNHSETVVQLAKEGDIAPELYQLDESRHTEMQALIRAGFTPGLDCELPPVES